MSRVAHFELVSPEPATEIDFFRSVFGWDIQRWGDESYWLADTGEEAMGINGAFRPSSGPDDQRSYVWIGVDDIDATIEAALAAGATIALQKTEAPGVGITAVLKSPTGIMFGVIQPDLSAMPMTAPEA